MYEDEQTSVKAIAFYLPQYHPIPENDAWWGKGFTEWRAVVRARPSFAGHHQPHEPADLGYYDLRVRETRIEQAELARRHGIHGFCYYHYWFDGKRLLDRPLQEVMEAGEPDFSFCVAWANEQWTRVWNGEPEQVLMAQSYRAGWAADFILDLLPMLLDPRYIRIDGKPLILICRVGLVPDIQGAVGEWRRVCREHGIDDLFVAGIESVDRFDPRLLGLDGAVEFPPFADRLMCYSRRDLQLTDETFSGIVADYPSYVSECLRREDPGYVWFRGIMPGWDNTPRRGARAKIFLGSTPSEYRRWLDGLLRWTIEQRAPGQRLVFVNAWNEWAEGAHLEPDEKFGLAYLRETQAALLQGGSSHVA
ncbi:glycoside hydrolase family 99-like domain-containing protein (plasmid) [Ralstonia solanacearum]|nr:glycoside hydrolase family 99-like domain-containing protein [Ralstonia solanacearum]